jgi:chromosome segregation ATPase
MSNISLAIGYLIVVMHQFWDGPKLIEVGTTLDVSRQIRNNLVGGQVARDATDEEIAAYRSDSKAAEEGGDDDRTTIAALATAQAELGQVAAARDALQEKVTGLEALLGTLTTERDTLRTDLEALKAKKSGKPAPAAE